MLIALTLAAKGDSVVDGGTAGTTTIRFVGDGTTYNSGAWSISGGTTALSSSKIVGVDFEDDATTAGTAAGSLAKITTAEPFALADYASSGIAKGTYVALKIKPSDGQHADLENSTVMDTAKCFAVKVPSAAGKHTTVNPKFDILQQGYDPVNKVSHVQTMEPLATDS